MSAQDYEVEGDYWVDDPDDEDGICEGDEDFIISLDEMEI